MYIYSVKSRVNNEVVAAWESFFLNHHLDDLIQTGCFTKYQFKKLIMDDPMSTYYVADYYYNDSEDLQRYQTHFAQDLKQDVISRFKGKFHSDRIICQVLTK